VLRNINILFTGLSGVSILMEGNNYQGESTARNEWHASITCCITTFPTTTQLCSSSQNFTQQFLFRTIVLLGFIFSKTIVDIKQPCSGDSATACYW